MENPSLLLTPSIVVIDARTEEKRHFDSVSEAMAWARQRARELAGPEYPGVLSEEPDLETGEGMVIKARLHEVQVSEEDEALVFVGFDIGDVEVLAGWQG